MFEEACAKGLWRFTFYKLQCKYSDLNGNKKQNNTPNTNKRVWDVKYLSENYYIKHNSLEDAKDNKQCKTWVLLICIC